MGRVDGTSRDNGRPAGVADSFQVSEHSVDPVLANRRRNLLSYEDSGPAGTGEAKKVGPQVPIVSLGFTFACDGERLARRAAGPKFPVLGPPSKSSCEGPPTDSCEEVALSVAGKVLGFNIGDAPGVYVAGRYQTLGDEAAQPLRGVGFELVVVIHSSTLCSWVRRSRGGLMVARAACSRLRT